MDLYLGIGWLIVIVFYVILTVYNRRNEASISTQEDVLPDEFMVRKKLVNVENERRTELKHKQLQMAYYRKHHYPCRFCGYLFDCSTSFVCPKCGKTN